MSDFRSDDSGTQRPGATADSTAADAAIGRSGGDRSEQPGNSQASIDPSNRDERGSLSRPGESSGSAGPSGNESGSEQEPAATGDSTAADAAIGRSGGDRSEQPGNSQASMDPSNRDERGSLPRPGESSGTGSSDNESGSEAGHSELDPPGRDNAGTPDGRHDLGPGAEAGPDDGDPGFEVLPEYTDPDGVDGLDYPGPEYDGAAGDGIEYDAEGVGQEFEGGMSGRDGTSKEGTVPVPRSDATDPDPQKAQADVDKVAQFQQEMEGAADEYGALTEFIVTHSVEHGLAEMLAKGFGVAAEGAIGIAGLVAGLDGRHDGQVPEDYGPVTELPEITIEGTPSSPVTELPEITIEGTPTIDVHDLPDAPSPGQ